jgi:tRNA dimethylallyltransferase
LRSSESKGGPSAPSVPSSLPKVLIVTGPTGSGKSALALKLAEELCGAVINADSLSFYKGFDIGTAKPSKEEMGRVPHYLFDILEPDELFDAADFIRLARPLIKELCAKGLAPLVTGGTGFYIRSLTKGLFEGPGRNPEFRESLREAEAKGTDLHELLAKCDPEAARRINKRDRIRIERALEVLRFSGKSIVDAQNDHRLSEKPFESLSLVLDQKTPLLDARLTARVQEMLNCGLIEETRAHLDSGLSPELKPLKSVGYREAVSYLKGEVSLGEISELIYLRTRRLAKRQRTWFRGQLPEGIRLDPDEWEKALALAKAFFRGEAFL